MTSQLYTYASTKYWKIRVLMVREPHPAFVLVAAIATATILSGTIAFHLGSIYG